jgi:hypothetical protein
MEIESSKKCFNLFCRWMFGCVCLLNVVSEHSVDEAGLVTYLVLVIASFVLLL